MAVAVAMVLSAAGCGGDATASHGPVHVLYAGSLVNLMEREVGPGFAAATGEGYQGFGGGSQAVANAVKGQVRTGDVFIAASPTVQASLEGARNGDWVRWYSTFATAPLVIGYSPGSRFAAALRTKPWYDVLAEPGLKIGITDPRLDPKGALTVAALRRTQRLYRLPAAYATGVVERASVFPEEELLGRVESGQLDAGFFYTDEARAAHLSTVALGRVHAAARFSVTVLERAGDPSGAAEFVRYLLTTAGPQLRAAGLHLLRPRLAGPRAAVPASLRALVG